jgi:predicted PurR-regulated permease PerM
MTTAPQRRFLVLLLAAAVLLVALVLRPFWTSLLVGAVLAAALHPLMEWLAGRVRRRPAAAAIIVVAVLVAGALPLTALVATLARQALEGVAWLRQALASEGVAGLLERLPPGLAALAERAVASVPELQAELQRLAGQGGGQAVAALGGFVAATGVALLRTAVALAALYFLLVDGRGLLAWLEAVAPLPPGQFRELAAEFRRTSVAVLVATLGTAGIQAAAALVGFIVLGVPAPLFLTAITFVVALIPAVGGTVVVLAVAALQFATGHTWTSLFLAVYGLAVVSTVDTVARPYLLRGGMEMPIGIVFLALLGGVAAFGPIGVLVGPLAVTFFIAAVRLWRREQEGVRAAATPSGPSDAAQPPPSA